LGRMRRGCGSFYLLSCGTRNCGVFTHFAPTVYSPPHGFLPISGLLWCRHSSSYCDAGTVSHWSNMV
jgi:hypothetical protein